jgi:hypothetical protein
MACPNLKDKSEPYFCHLKFFTTYRILSKCCMKLTHTHTHTYIYYDVVINQVMPQGLTLHRL